MSKRDRVRGERTRRIADLIWTAGSLVRSVADQGLRLPEEEKALFQRLESAPDRLFPFTALDREGALRLLVPLDYTAEADQVTREVDEAHLHGSTPLVALPSTVAPLEMLRSITRENMPTIVSVKLSRSRANWPVYVRYRLHRLDDWDTDTTQRNAARSLRTCDGPAECVTYLLPPDGRSGSHVRLRYSPWSGAFTRALVRTDRIGFVRIVRDRWTNWCGGLEVSNRIPASNHRRSVFLYLDEMAGVRPDSLQLVDRLHRESSQFPDASLLIVGVCIHGVLRRMVWDRSRSRTTLQLLHYSPDSGWTIPRVIASWHGFPGPGKR